MTGAGQITVTVPASVRYVLDTLIAAGVARTHGDAITWAVRVAERHESAWLAGLRDALDGLADARRDDPAGDPADFDPAAPVPEHGPAPLARVRQDQADPPDDAGPDRAG